MCEDISYRIKTATSCGHRLPCVAARHSQSFVDPALAISARLLCMVITNIFALTDNLNEDDCRALHATLPEMNIQLYTYIS